MTVRQITAIQTRHDGVLFRSRTEARYAVFFDHLRIPWEYEPQGFDIGDGEAYLPDFLLGMGRIVWAEIKGAVGADPGGEERWRKFLRAQPSGTTGYLLTAMNGQRGQLFTMAVSDGAGSLAEAGVPWSSCPGGYHFELQPRGSLAACRQCGDTAPCSSCEGTGLHKGGPVICYCCDPYGSGRVPVSGAPWDDDSLIGDAMSAARSARFETGA